MTDTPTKLDDALRGGASDAEREQLRTMMREGMKNSPEFLATVEQRYEQVFGGKSGKKM